MIILRCCMLAARVASRRSGVVLLAVVNIGHAAIHGTVLDGGALDGLIAQTDALAATLIVHGDG